MPKDLGSNRSIPTMSGRSNGCSELVRFWLQERHGCLIDDELPVPVPYALSD